MKSSGFEVVAYTRRIHHIEGDGDSPIDGEWIIVSEKLCTAQRFAGAGFTGLGAGAFQLVDLIADEEDRLIDTPHYDVLPLQCI